MTSTISSTCIDTISTFKDVLQTEIDNHADTHFFGKNFVPYSWPGLACTASPFLSEYESQEDVQICSGATAYTTEEGETIILIFGQGLWFGNRMDKSLINPNQCRSYGIGVCDDPTDPYRQIGFFHEDEFFPLFMQGTTATILTRCPTRKELDECRKFFMSDPDLWDPSNVTFCDARSIDSVHISPPPIMVLPAITNIGHISTCCRLIANSSLQSQIQCDTSSTMSRFGEKTYLHPIVITK